MCAHSIPKRIAILSVKPMYTQQSKSMEGNPEYTEFNMQKAERAGYIYERGSQKARCFNTSNSLKSHHHSIHFLFGV